MTRPTESPRSMFPRTDAPAPMCSESTSPELQTELFHPDGRNARVGTAAQSKPDEISVVGVIVELELLDTEWRRAVVLGSMTLTTSLSGGISGRSRPVFFGMVSFGQANVPSSLTRRIEPMTGC
jgi:hypothetical protein